MGSGVIWRSPISQTSLLLCFEYLYKNNHDLDYDWLLFAEFFKFQSKEFVLKSVKIVLKQIKEYLIYSKLPSSLEALYQLAKFA